MGKAVESRGARGENGIFIGCCEGRLRSEAIFRRWPGGVRKKAQFQAIRARGIARGKLTPVAWRGEKGANILCERELIRARGIARK